VAGVGLLGRWCWVTLVLLAAGCATPPVPTLTRFEFERYEMALPFRLVFYAADFEQARHAADAAFDRIRALNDCLSDYDYDSELSRLSRTSGEGQAVAVSEDLWRVLERAVALSRRTDGAFDVTVGPYVILWRKARRDRALPDPARLERARRAVGFDKVRWDRRRRTVELLAPDMRLDLGGIAKGYAIDEALRTLRSRGIRRALVTGSGDMAAGDPPPGRPGWRVAVAPLDRPEAPPAVFVLLHNRALATSGDVFQHVEIDGMRYSHIVDPRTGVGLTDQSLVTIIARDCATADSLATAVSVLGPPRGLALVEKTQGAAAYIVRRPRDLIEVAESSEFKKYVDPSGPTVAPASERSDD